MAHQARPESPVSVTGFEDQGPQTSSPFPVSRPMGASTGSVSIGDNRQQGLQPQAAAQVRVPPAGSTGRPVPVSATTERAKANQSRLAKRAPKATVTAAGGMFSGYTPSTSKVLYSENKVGVMPRVEKVVEEIAVDAGVDITEPEEASRFLEALVIDVYLNPYSDKQVFDGEITIGDYVLPRVHIRNVITKYVGTNHRRFARAMAPLVVQVMHDNYDTYGEVLDKRMSELNLGTRAEAVNAFDGADSLVCVDRTTAQKNAAAKALALSQRSSHRAYGLMSSAAAMGDHRNEKSPEVDGI